MWVDPAVRYAVDGDAQSGGRAADDRPRLGAGRYDARPDALRPEVAAEHAERSEGTHRLCVRRRGSARIAATVGRVRRVCRVCRSQVCGLGGVAGGRQERRHSADSVDESGEYMFPPALRKKQPAYERDAPVYHCLGRRVRYKV